MASGHSVLRRLAVWLFWPGLALIVWGEVLRNPNDSQLFWDKAEHFTAYFGLAAMATLVIGRRRALIWALVAIVALGGALEIIQGFVGRDASWGDFAANTIGVLAGLGVALVVIRLGGGKSLVGSPPAE